MMQFMPFFPLELVVFPREPLNLHIFEERYKQLTIRCFDEKKPFGIISVIQGKVQEYGTSVIIEKIEKIHPDGNMDIRTRGQEVFKVLEFSEKVENALYSGGIVSLEGPENADYTSASAHPDTFKIFKELLVQLAALLQIEKNLIPSDEKFVSFRVAHYLNMPVEKEFQVLLAADEEARMRILVHYLKEKLPDLIQREEIRQKIQLNGHFKHIIPPQL